MTVDEAVPSTATRPRPTKQSQAEDGAVPAVASAPDAALAFDLARAAAAGTGLVFVDATGSRLEHLAAIARVVQPALEVLVAPAWDSSPYDRLLPSPAIIGQRVATLARLAEQPGIARLVLTSARAMLQRVPAPAHWAEAVLRMAAGDALDEDAIRTRLAEFGYQFDEHVARPGEVAMRGKVIDVFPGGASVPVRLLTEAGRVVELHQVDPVTQRSCGDLDSVLLRPMVEVQPEPEQVEAEAERIAHAEAAAHDMADQPPPAGALDASLSDYLTGLQVLVHPDALDRCSDLEAQAAEAYEAARIAARTVASGGAPPKPHQLYVTTDAVRAWLADAKAGTIGDAADAVAAAKDLPALVSAIKAAKGTRTVIAAGEPRRRRRSAVGAPRRRRPGRGRVGRPMRRPGQLPAGGGGARLPP